MVLKCQENNVRADQNSGGRGEAEHKKKKKKNNNNIKINK